MSLGAGVFEVEDLHSLGRQASIFRMLERGIGLMCILLWLEAVHVSCTSDNESSVRVEMSPKFTSRDVAQVHARSEGLLVSW